MRVVALKCLVEKDKTYLPGAVIDEDSVLFGQREYYARIGMVRIEDPFSAPIATATAVVDAVAAVPQEAIEKAKAAAASIMRTGKKGGETAPVATTEG